MAAFLAFLGASFRTRAALQLEILALRHQIDVLRRSVKPPKLIAVDRFLWVWLCSVWNGWILIIDLVFPNCVGAELNAETRPVGNSCFAVRDFERLLDERI